MRNTWSHVITRVVPASRSTPSIVIRVQYAVSGNRLVVDGDHRFVEDTEVLAEIVPKAVPVADDGAARPVADVSRRNELVDDIKVAGHPHLVEPTADHPGWVDGPDSGTRHGEVSSAADRC